MEIRAVRKFLQSHFRTSAEFDAFVLDYFDGIYRRFNHGMDRIQKENLLLTYADLDEIVAALRSASAYMSPSQHAELERLLGAEHAQTPEPANVPRNPSASANSGTAMPLESDDSPTYVTVLYEGVDVRFYERFRKHLAPQLRSNRLRLFSVDSLTPGTDSREALKQELERAVLVVILISPDLLFSDEMNEWIELTLRRQQMGLCGLLPILVRSTSLSETPFAALALAPRNGQPIAEWRDQDQAWVEVANAFSVAVKFRRPPVNSDAGRSVGSHSQAWGAAAGTHQTAAGQPPARPLHEIQDIFPQSGIPEITYIEPAGFDTLLGQLRQRGRVLAIEGPSGIGKTTALFRALKVIGIDDPSTQWYRATDANDLSRLDTLLKGNPSGHIVVDDFHYLEDGWKGRLAQTMQAACTALKPLVKFTAIGVAQVKRDLVRHVPNLLQRTERISLARQPDSKLLDVLTAGEQAANIEFQQRDQIISESMGSFSLLQDLCYRLATKVGVARTQRQQLLILQGPLDVRNERLAELDAFREPLRALLRVDKGANSPRGVGLALLWLLARAPEQQESLESLRDRYPPLSDTIDGLLPDRLSQMLQNQPRLGELLTCTDGLTVSVSDPRLSFFLRFLDWSELIASSGLTLWQLSADGTLSLRADVAAPAGGTGRSPAAAASIGFAAQSRAQPAMARFPRSLQLALAEGKLIPFIGAGVSRAVLDKSSDKPMFPSWGELLSRIAQRLEQELKPDLAELLRASVQLNDGRLMIEAASRARAALGGQWNQILEDSFRRRRKQDADPASLELARAIWDLGSKLLITTNYDPVLRWTQPGDPDEFAAWNVTSPYEQQRLLRDGVSENTVWHLHGSADAINNIIIAADGSAGLYSENNPTQEADYKAALYTLRMLLTQRTFLFVGFSFTDPWFSAQVDWVRGLFGDSVDRHFLLVKQRDRALTAERLIRGAGLPLELIEFQDFGAPLVETLRSLARCRAASAD